MNIPLPAAKRRARIEIIPLIDIVFFLLATFVMVSLSMVKNQGVLVKLPAASTGTTQDKSQSTATVSVTESGKIFWDKEAMDLKGLRKRLAAFKAEHPEGRIFIQGDERASFGEAVQVLDEARKLGIMKVAVQTRGKNSDE